MLYQQYHAKRKLFCVVTRACHQLGGFDKVESVDREQRGCEPG
jgi:hypothetical protein